MPSLKPNRLRAVACWVDVDDVRPNPSCAHRTAVVPKPMRTRLRTACTATCGSFAQAWMQMSPPERAGSSWSPGNGGRSASAAGPPVGDAELVEERAGRSRSSPSATPAGRSSASPVSAGGASRLRGTAPFSRGLQARRHALGGRASTGSASAARAAWPVEVRSSAAKYSWSCAGVMMPAWCSPRNGTTSLPGGGIRRRRGRARSRTPRRRRPPPRRRRSSRATGAGRTLPPSSPPRTTSSSAQRGRPCGHPGTVTRLDDARHFRT